MKKSFFLAAAAALAMTSCSNDEMTDINNGNTIGFRAATQTRATETTTANLENFFVTAFKGTATYFNAVEFTKEGSAFTSDPAYYWPGDNSELSFFAYSPKAEDLGGTLNIASSGITLSNFSPASEISDQVDFITATTTGKKSENEAGVELAFAHQLSQIEIKAKNTNDAYVYKVVGVRIGQPISNGTFEVNEWKYGTTKSNYKANCMEVTLGSDAVSLMGEGGNAMLIPQQLVKWDSENDKTNETKNAYLAVNVQITTKDGVRIYPAKTDYDWAAVGIDTKWEAGKKYVYTLDFSKGAGNVDPEKPTPTDPDDTFDPGDPILGSPIIFVNVTVSEWTPAIDVPVELE